MTRRQKRPSSPRPIADEKPLPFAVPILFAAFLLPNIGAFFCGFVLDDLPLIVENDRVHSLDGLGRLWVSAYWPDRVGLTLYRPVTQTVWSVLWFAGGGKAWPFHAVNLALGAVNVLLVHRYLLMLHVKHRTAFFAAFLFALFPIHTEATTSVVGSGELLAAAFGLGALILFKAGHRILALALFALAVFSKESAAALVAIAWLATDKPRRRFWLDGVAAIAIIAAVLTARSLVARGPSFIPPVDNPMSLLPAGRRILTALWVQCLYIWKTIVPITLSADHSYKQIPLVMGLADLRAWGGISLLVAAFLVTRWKGDLLAPILAYAILFLPTANILFPIGTMMGERLAYLPSAALAVVVAVTLASIPINRAGMIAVLSVVALVYGARTAWRNLDWRNADAFYPRLVQTSPDSAKAHFFYGTLQASRGDDVAAIVEYDRAIAIFTAYSEAYHNRGNAQARLGKTAEAMESYRAALRFDPGHRGAAENLWRLESGLAVKPPRRRL